MQNMMLDEEDMTVEYEKTKREFTEEQELDKLRERKYISMSKNKQKALVWVFPEKCKYRTII